jgi:hypothetical protein
MSDDVESAPKKKRKCCRFRTIIFGLLAIVLIAALAIYWLWNARPAIYHDHQQFLASTTEQHRKDLAQQLQKQTVNTLSFSPRKPNAENEKPFGTRKLVITAEQANAWMDQELAGWLRREDAQLPAGVSNPAIAFENGRVQFGFMFESPDVSQWITVSSRIDVNQTRARFKVDSVHGGRLPLPAAKIAELLKDQIPSKHVDQVMSAFTGIEIDPAMELDEGSRKARLIGCDIESGQMTLTIKIDPGSPSPSGRGK